MTTVKQLIAFLNTLDQDMEVEVLTRFDNHTVKIHTKFQQLILTIRYCGTLQKQHTIVIQNSKIVNL
jgi:hypothetical protein